MLINEIEKIIKSGKLSGYRANSRYLYGGEQAKLLESEWSSYFGAKHAICCNSATSGLWASLGCYLDINANLKSSRPEVIVTPYSMTCSASLPLLFGAKPVFADIEEDFYCLDPRDIERKITKNTVGIVVVDLFGMPYDADKINEIARANNLFVIEDAAQAIGSTYKGKYAGTLGDIGVYSLNQHKHLSCGEGGVIVTDNDELAMRLRLLINHAEAVNNELNRYEFTSMVGMNLRMTELTAIIARDQLKNIKKLIKPYVDGAKGLDIPVREKCTSTYYKYATMDPSKHDPEKFDMKQGYIKPLYKFPLFRTFGYRQNLCPVCDYIEQNIYIANLKGIY